MICWHGDILPASWELQRMSLSNVLILAAGACEWFPWARASPYSFPGVPSFNSFSLLSLPPAVGEGFCSPIQYSTRTKLVTPHEFETAKTTFEEKAGGRYFYVNCQWDRRLDNSANVMSKNCCARRWRIATYDTTYQMTKLDQRA
jgi:hypothetical protein